MWQGIPSVAITPGGRLFASFYSGGVTEQPGNFWALVISGDDGGKATGAHVFVSLREPRKQN